MNFKKYLLALVAGSFLFVSCSSDDDQPVGQAGAFANGTFVLNEGNSTPATASVTFIGNVGSVQQDIYRTVNPGKPALGSYLQSMFFDDDKAFIISGSANKVTVVNRYTFEFIASVETNFSSPRYGTVLNGKAYITNYADYNTGADDFLTVINLADYSTTTMPLNNWSEKIMSENGKLYILNGYYGSGTSVTVLNPATGAAEAVIELGASPESFEEEDGMLYILGSGKLTRVNMATNQIAGSITLPPALTYSAQDLTIENNKIYFTAGTSVYAMDINSTVVPTAPLLSYESTSQWGGMYGFNVNNDRIYVAEGGDFASDSEIYVYSLNGTLLRTHDVGVGPNSFYFND